MLTSDLPTHTKFAKINQRSYLDIGFSAMGDFIVIQSHCYSSVQVLKNLLFQFWEIIYVHKFVHLF